MIFEQVLAHIDKYRSHGEIFAGTEFLMESFGLESPYFQGFEFRDDDKPNFIVVTTEGEFGGLQTLKIPKNLLDFDLSLVLNLLAHEMLHVKQKTQKPYVTDKNEREWQAYCEMLFHTHFPQIPEAPVFNQLQFCEKALMYYQRMEAGGELQEKYASEKLKVEEKQSILNKPSP